MSIPATFQVRTESDRRQRLASVTSCLALSTLIPSSLPMRNRLTHGLACCARSCRAPQTFGPPSSKIRVELLLDLKIAKTVRKFPSMTWRRVPLSHPPHTGVCSGLLRHDLVEQCCHRLLTGLLASASTIDRSFLCRHPSSTLEKRASTSASLLPRTWSKCCLCASIIIKA